MSRRSGSSPQPAPASIGGYGATDTQDLTEETLRLGARWISPFGRLALRIHLATMVWPYNLPVPRGDARFELFTTHEQPGQFGIELAQIARGEANVARPRGDRLA